MTLVTHWSGYVPRFRIEAGEFMASLGAFGAAGVRRKSVPGVDEDAYTMAVEAGIRLIRESGTDPKAIGCLSLGSCSMPYVERSCAPGIALALGLSPSVKCFEHGYSSRAGAEAFWSAVGCLSAGECESALVIASEAARGDGVRSSIEQGAGAAAAAFLLGRSPGADFFLEVLAHEVFMDESLGVRFRPREGAVGLGDLGIAAHSAQTYVRCCARAVKAVFERTGTSAADYAHFVPAQPDARLPLRLAAALGFRDPQVERSILAAELGDLGAASPLLPLAVVADEAEPGQMIMVCSYGSGAAASAFALRAGGSRSGGGALRQSLASGGKSLSFVEYLKLRRFI